MHPTLGNLSTPKAIGDTRLAKRSDTIAGKPLFMCLLSFRTNARIMTLTLDSPFGIADGGWRIADRRSARFRADLFLHACVTPHFQLVFSGPRGGDPSIICPAAAACM